MSNGNTIMVSGQEKKFPWSWTVCLAVITALVFFPMLQNGFTNWDDNQYVTNNPIVQEADWKGVLTKPVASNYHPLTIASFVLNYQFSELEPKGYLLINLLLHICNTVLVCYFIYRLTKGSTFIAVFTALVFGIHPMHVESVAWISARKDVLYTCFFLLSLIQYLSYLRKERWTNLLLCMLFFVLALLSKPAAIVLPLVLMIIDLWEGKFKSSKLLIPRVLLFATSVAFAIITFHIQSQDATVDLPLWQRPLFACYGLMNYTAKFLIPYPLSAFHPFPTELSAIYYTGPAFLLFASILIWRYRENRAIVSGSLFFAVNLMLVLQLIPIGFTVVSERYTYIPYIGLAFIAGSLLEPLAKKKQAIQWSIYCVIMIAFGSISFQRTKTWSDSDTLWSDVIDKYPEASLPHTNRAAYLITEQASLENFERALDDCNSAISADSNNVRAYELKTFIHSATGKHAAVITDAAKLLQLSANNKTAYQYRAVAYRELGQYDAAYEDLSKTIALDPKNETAYFLRASLLYNSFKNYRKAIDDYTSAINLNKENGTYYLERSYCYYKLEDMATAKKEAHNAEAHGASLPEGYKQAIAY